MLVLSRKVNEEIVIAQEIRVKLIRLGRRQVRLGISAPPGIDIRRAELTAADSPERGRTAEFKTAGGAFP